MTRDKLTSLLALQDQWQAQKLDGFADAFRAHGEAKTKATLEDLVVKFGLLEAMPEPMISFMGVVGKLGTIVLWNKLAELQQEKGERMRRHMIDGVQVGYQPHMQGYEIFVFNLAGDVVKQSWTAGRRKDALEEATDLVRSLRSANDKFFGLVTGRKPGRADQLAEQNARRFGFLE